jgi:hypothetical protein
MSRDDFLKTYYKKYVLFVHVLIVYNILFLC